VGSLDHVRKELTMEQQIANSDRHFDPDALAAHLPGGAVKYLSHAIRPGALIPRSARIRFHGRLRLRPQGPWLPFAARQEIQTGRGFLFEARAWLGPLPVTTKEQYDGNEAHSRIRLLGLIPVVTKTGPDALRAARQRLLVESIWLPAAFLPEFGAAWAEQDGQLRLVIPVQGEDVAASLRIGPAGELRELNIDRWSDLTDDGSYAWIPFASRVVAERAFGDYTIPSEVQAVWWAGTDREFAFFSATVDDATFTL
jgi:hypothetical protein